MLEKIPTCLRTPGRFRQITVLLVILLTASIGILLTLFGRGVDLQIATEVFLVSLVGFSAVAAVSWDCVRGWRAVDFPWVCASFIAIIVALANISEASRRERLSLAKSEMSSAFADLIYWTNSMLVNDCVELPTRVGSWQRSFPGQEACDRIAHFLPQMRRDFDNPDSSSGNAWGMEFPPNGPAGSLAVPGKKFDRLSNDYMAVKKANPQPTGLQARLVGTEIKFWYLMMAFFVGLRLSKVTAEWLHIHATRKN